ncbi:hypothetical protein L227DRAFT_581676 [Lentinus tigrinus ALCF2SS1-6]|uniref:Transmembrane protein n=1 Tax=Lentinus tigrinus ALCF2SS1-6 TaxID=1328759 RepID=A0A5C2RSF9_9APHY|nr:hypothetical protein L227DRAFT_581676 [Lentinus tigrinus ALCF2SS1-6]
MRWSSNIAATGFSALRTCALCPTHVRWPLATLVLLLSSVSIGINFATYRWLSSAVIPILGCSDENVTPLQLIKDFTIISRTCLILADLIVLGVTWHGTYQTTQLVRVAAGEQSKHTYSGILLRDGTVYFLILATLNVLHLLFTFVSITIDTVSDTSLVTIFTQPITSILVSRFLIDLQEVHQYRANSQLSSLSAGQGSLHFATSRVMGSLGESLPPPGDTLLEDARLAAEDASEDSGHGGDEEGQDTAEAGANAQEVRA